MSLIDFELLFRPVEEVDTWLTGLFAGAPLLVALGIAFVLGLRHASDPDHLVAVTSLVAADDGGTRSATRLGAWWGLGHAATLVLLGVPLIVFKSALPTWLESGAEKAVGVVIILLALRVTWKWAHGDYRAGRHSHVSRGRSPRAALAPAPAPGRSRSHAPAPRRAISAAGIRHRPAARARGNRRRRRLAARRPAVEVGGCAQPGCLRADVSPLDGGLHDRLRVGADPAADRARLPKRLDPRTRPVRPHVRPLVRRRLAYADRRAAAAVRSGAGCRHEAPG